MKKTKVVCIGEALIDKIRNKSNQGFSNFLGGAPANVAFALRKLRIDTVFIGRLGSDEFGEKFIKEFNDFDVNIDFVQLDRDLPTRIITGDRYFSGFDASHRTVYADEALSKSLLAKDLKGLEKLFSETIYFVAGTNILSSSISAESVYFLLKIANKFNVKIIIDLNWRDVFWDYSSFSSETSRKDRVNLIMKFINYSHILKLAKEEAILFFESENPLEISKSLSNRPNVIITDGANPISWFINGLQGITEIPNSTRIVDTTGAGDTFLAGLITKFISCDFPKDKLDIQNCVSFASVCGLLTCLGEGAIEQQPDYQKVEEFLGSNIV